jgi:PAS domain S-box-containing protein
MTARRPSPIDLYVGALGLAMIVLVAVSLAGWDGREPLRWVTFTALFGIAEYVDIFFHHERGRQSLNPSEAILLPMIVVLPPEQVVLGVVVAMLVIRIVHYREGILRFVFNIAQYGLGAGVAAVFWVQLGTSRGELAPWDAIVAIAAVVVFDVMSHVLVAGAISLSEKTGMLSVLRSVTGTARLYLLGNALIGLLLAAAYRAADWTLVLFPLMLLLSRLASRALLRQSQERERSEHLHTAARALAAGMSVESAIAGFLAAVVDVMSAVESVALIQGRDGLTVFRAHRGREPGGGVPVSDPRLRRLFEDIAAGDSLVVTPGSKAAAEAAVDFFQASSLVAVPLVEGDDVVGALIAIDRVGTDEYEAADAHLLEALGHELVLSLTSFRLFDEVSEQRERFQQIFQSSQEGIALLDAEGAVLAWNPALARMSGVAEDDILGSKWSERITLIDEEQHYLLGADLGAASPGATLELVRRDGASRWVSVSPGPVAFAERPGWVVLVRDVTAEHDLDKAKTDFIATISHELRTPLTGIKGSVDVLRTQGATLPPDRLDRLIEMTSWGAERLERLVMNLLIISNIDMGDMPVRLEQVELGSLVRDRVDGVLADHPLVDVTMPDTDVMIRADPRWVAQAIDGVLDNARKFGGERGRVMVAVTIDDGTAEVAVSDEGPGVPPDERERIFGRFVRLGDVNTRETPGAGIGLHIAQRSVEAMGGTIGVDDREGDTTFRLRFPLVTPAEGGAPARSSIEAEHG